MMDNLQHLSGDKDQTFILFNLTAVLSCSPSLLLIQMGKNSVNRVKVQIMSSRLNRSSRFLAFISRSRVPLSVFNKTSEILFLKSADATKEEVRRR